MAALTPNRLHGLIERLLYPRRSQLHSRALQRWGYRAVRRLVHEEHPSPDTADAAWLKRIELRGSRPVIAMLECSGFPDLRGEMHALFVDGRCGLIRSYAIGCAAKLERRRAVGNILAQASNCHADGIILATNDLDQEAIDAPEWKKLVRDVFFKGEATEIFLLDNFVLTASGWTRMFSFNGREYN